jgi:hypothetical protein
MAEDKAGWKHEKERHSICQQLSQFGLHMEIKPWKNVPDVRGLEDTIKYGMDNAPLRNLNLAFEYVELAVDTSRMLPDEDMALMRWNKRVPEVVKKAIIASPSFMVATDKDARSWILVDRYGTFYGLQGINYTKVPDNHYMKPIGYEGVGAKFQKPVPLESKMMYTDVEGYGLDTRVLDIFGLLGFETTGKMYVPKQLAGRM